MISKQVSNKFTHLSRQYSQIQITPIVKYYQRTKLRNFNINYIKVGNGPHAVFCFPGIMGAMSSHLTPLINGFDKSKFTIYSWDQPGYGQTRIPERNITMDSFQEEADLLVDFVKTLEPKKFSILGWSGGALSALLFVINYPQFVNRFVCWGAFAVIDNEAADIFRGYRDTSTWNGKMKDTLLEEYDEDIFGRHWMSWMDVLVQMNTEKEGEFCSKGLSKISCPTLILHGALDPIVKVKHAHYLHQYIKDSKLCIMEKGKHNIHLRFPEEFNTIVQKYLLTPAV